jgi:hypothetical protein
MSKLSDDFYEKWDHIISEVDKTSVPIECIRSLRIKLKNNRQKTINLQSLRRKGYELEDIEAVVNETLEGYGEDVRSVDFYLDVESVAEIVQPETDKLLNKIE